MILKEIVDLMEIARDEIAMNYSNMKVCELGSQKMKGEYGTGKNYLLSLGVIEHISIDLN